MRFFSKKQPAPIIPAETPSCGTCHHWRTWMDGGGRTACKRYPPTVVTVKDDANPTTIMGAYPLTKDYDRCGEYQRKGTANVG